MVWICLEGSCAKSSVSRADLRGSGTFKRWSLEGGVQMFSDQPSRSKQFLLEPWLVPALVTKEQAGPLNLPGFLAHHVVSSACTSSMVMPWPGGPHQTPHRCGCCILLDLHPSKLGAEYASFLKNTALRHIVITPKKMNRCKRHHLFKNQTSDIPAYELLKSF